MGPTKATADVGERRLQEEDIMSDEKQIPDSESPVEDSTDNPTNRFWKDCTSIEEKRALSRQIRP